MGQLTTVKQLDKGRSIALKLFARDRYSIFKLRVKPGERYTFKVDKSKGKWVDLIIPTYGFGWDFILAPNKGRRLPGYPLFHLCGCMDNDDSTSFPIGNELQNWEVESEGILSFFANDMWMMYFNNWGALTLVVERLK